MLIMLQAVRDRHIMLFKTPKILFLNSSEVAHNSQKIYSVKKKELQAQNRFLVTQIILSYESDHTVTIDSKQSQLPDRLS